MGREANCLCELNGETGRVKALLEPPELILRGAMRRRIPFSTMKRVSTVDGQLRVDCGDTLCLDLGEAMAAKWARAMLAPAPALAKKLGIVPGSAVRTMGKIDDVALISALREVRTVTRGPADVVVARVSTEGELAGAFEKSAALLGAGTPIWIVYRKGPGHAIGEADVRRTGLAAGEVDVKVASVSAQLTALKFVQRKRPPR